MSAKYIVGALIFFSGLGIFWAQEAQKPTALPPPQSPHSYKITPEESARKNPVKFTENSVARGKKIYSSQCTMCHGQNADGKGDAVAEMNITPPDFTKPDTLKDRTDGDLFAILSQGSGNMPGQQDRMKEKQKWDLINFLRATSGKVPAKSTGPEPDENIVTVPQN
ncbi:MAG TPA: cytochrome c [Terriglobia bacterium]|nr:cytochrome c [Terriglobia bacterium]